LSEIPDLFRSLNRARVRYLLIGGLASVLHGAPRTTLDVDLLLPAGKENLRRALPALRRLGLVPDIDDPDEILGVGGVSLTNDLQVDLLTDLPREAFQDLWGRREIVRYGQVRVSMISRRDQIRLLRRAGRARDLEDADLLEDI